MSDANQTPNATPSEPPSGRRWIGPGFPRRRWKVAAVALLIGLAGFGIGRATSFAGHWRGHGFGPGFGMNQPMDPASAMRRAEYGIDRVLGSVDGTAEQKTKARAIADGVIKDLFPLRQSFRGNAEKIAAALKADKVDRIAIEQLRAEQLTLGEAVSKRVSQALGDIAEVLTPSQRAKLVERWQSRSWRG